MKCALCKIEMIEKKGIFPDGMEYSFSKCPKCGEELLDMGQLHDVAKKYREMKKYSAKISKWGSSIGVRIPKELAKKYHLKENKEVSFIPEKDSIRMITQ